MYDVYHYQNQQGGIQTCIFKSQNKGQTQYHTRNCQREHTDQMQQLDDRTLGGQGGDAGSKIGQTRTEQCRHKGAGQGIDQIIPDSGGEEHLNGTQGKCQVNGILPHKAQTEKGQNGQTKQKQDQGKEEIDTQIPEMVGYRLVFFPGGGIAAFPSSPQIREEGDHCRKQQNQTNGGATGEIHHSHNFTVHVDRECHFRTAGHQSNSVVRENHGENGKACGQDRSPQIGQCNGCELPQAGEPQNLCCFIDGKILILKCIVEHQKRYREGIQHRAQNDTGMTIEADIQSQQIGNQTIVSQQQYQSCTMGNAGNQHGNGKQHHKDGFEPDFGAVQYKSETEGKHNRNSCGTDATNQGVIQHREKLGGREGGPQISGIHGCEQYCQRQHHSAKKIYADQIFESMEGVVMHGEPFLYNAEDHSASCPDVPQQNAGYNQRRAHDRFLPVFRFARYCRCS